MGAQGGQDLPDTRIGTGKLGLDAIRVLSIVFDDYALQLGRVDVLGEFDGLPGDGDDGMDVFDTEALSDKLTTD